MRKVSQDQTVGELDKGKRYHQPVTILIPLLLAAFGFMGYLLNSFLLWSIVMGSLGGIIHDLVQNKGIVLYPADTQEGVYLGLGLGAFLGAVSGFIAYATFAAPIALDARSLVIPLTWGLGLKGVIDGATNKVTTELKTTT